MANISFSMSSIFLDKPHVEGTLTTSTPDMTWCSEKHLFSLISLNWYIRDMVGWYRLILRWKICWFIFQIPISFGTSHQNQNIIIKILDYIFYKLASSIVVSLFAKKQVPVYIIIILICQCTKRVNISTWYAQHNISMAMLPEVQEVFIQD